MKLGLYTTIFDLGYAYNLEQKFYKSNNFLRRTLPPFFNFCGNCFGHLLRRFQSPLFVDILHYFPF